MTTPCCAKPAIQTMDYVRHAPGDWDNPEPRVNRVCIRCWAHWFGPPEAVRQFTRAEWDAYVSAPEKPDEFTLSA